MRANLLHAHGSPGGFLYRFQACRCAACRAEKAESARRYDATHRKEKRASERRWRAANPEKAAEKDRRFRNTHRDARAEAGRRWRAQVDRAEAGRRWRAQAGHGGRSARWYLAHPGARAAHDRNRRARKLAAPGTHTAADVSAQYARQKGRCYWGRRVNPDCAVTLKGGYHVDHVVPLAGKRTSSNGRENIVLACPHCNVSKGAKDPMDWAGVLC